MQKSGSSASDNAPNNPGMDDPDHGPEDLTPAGTVPTVAATLIHSAIRGRQLVSMDHLLLEHELNPAQVALVLVTFGQSSASLARV